MVSQEILAVAQAAIKVGPNVNADELQKCDVVTLRVTDALVIRVEKP
jgi:hypothetical protein